MTEIRVDVDLVHPPSVVWRALTEAHLVTDWLPTNRFMIREDGTFTFQSSELTGLEDPIEGRIVSVEAPSRLVMRWEASNLHTVVTVTLAPRGSGTRFTMTQSGFLGPQGTMRRRVLLATYTALFKGPLTATLGKIEVEVEDPAPPAPPRRNDGLFNRLPRQHNGPSRSAPGLSSRMRSTAGPRPTTAVPGFAAAVLTARATGVAAVPTTVEPAVPAASLPARARAWLRSTWHRVAGRDWSADRRSQAVATGAAVLLLLALAAILIGKATALHPPGPPRTGGESPGPAQATIPGAAVAPTRSTPQPIVPAASRSPGPPVSPVSSPTLLPSGPARLAAGYKTENLSLTSYRVTITITNPSDLTADGWTLEIQLPLLDLTVRNVSGAVMTRTEGHLAFTPLDTTRTLKPGTTATVRFDVEGLGVRNEPFTCTIDQQPCSSIPG
ncbi:SRPBCC domain-containing protein [Dactylosporangium vinaceum]|uniref:SRPBCC domain-containing protein n=1 Tax=Dactylosporangium vinaceum TaxID=53362 RepID=A0ABV5MP08_9ACTN|nr:SRPBCC domain-containing protein [Dactylosporangium vinaceum]UAB95731.1 SRPBCC domain-containing protein [Dactylosporangium vinaceum]